MQVEKRAVFYMMNNKGQVIDEIWDEAEAIQWLIDSKDCAYFVKQLVVFALQGERAGQEIFPKREGPILLIFTKEDVMAEIMRGEIQLEGVPKDEEFSKRMEEMGRRRHDS